MKWNIKIQPKQLPEIILVAVFFVNLSAYGYFYYLKWNGLLNENTAHHFEVIRHFCESSFLYLLLFYYVSWRDRWRYSLKFMLYCISLLWMNNFPYVVFKYEVNLYFSISSLILYIIGVVIAIWVLTRR